MNKSKQNILSGSNLYTPADIREWITQMKDSLEKDRELFPQFIHEMEMNIPHATDPGMQAVLHSVLAEMYQNFYLQYAFQINQRTPLAGFVPDDIREWTSNLFDEKIRQELNASLQPPGILQSTSISQFREILQEGTDSPELRPTLYDFLAWRALDIQPTDSIYNALLAFRRSQTNEKATVPVELAYIQFRYQNPLEQMEALDVLLKKYEYTDLSVDIIEAKINLLEIQKYATQNPDSVTSISWQLATETVRRFPGHKRIGVLQNMIKNWENPFIQLEATSSVYPGKETSLNLHYRNTDKIEIRIYESTQDLRDIMTNKYRNEEEPKGRGNLIYSAELSLPVNLSYKEEKTEILIPALKEGMYEIALQASGKEIEIRKIINATVLAANVRTIPGRGTEVYVTDLQTGKPLNDVVVRYYEGTRTNMNKAGEIKSDKDGLVLLPNRKDIVGVAAVTATGNSTLITPLYTPYYNPVSDEKKTIVALLTDRKLYRPGQTVYFKGIAYQNDRENPLVIANHSFSVSFFDANNREVASKQVKSNEFGSFTGEFVIPRQGLTGTFSLRMAEGTITIQVEEYKRPTFFIEFEPIKDDIAAGDIVSIRGKAETFSGVALAGAEGTYRVSRSSILSRTYYNESNPQIAEGALQIESDGTFRITFQTKKEDRVRFPEWDRYQVSVMITDNKGESHEAFTAISVGSKSMVLIVDMPQQQEKEQLNVVVRAQTMNGEDISTNGTFRIYPLSDTEQPGIWKEENMLVNGEFETGKPIRQALFAQLSSERYRFVFEARDSKGRTVQLSRDIVLYSNKDNSPPVFSPLWIVRNRSSYLPGETIEIVAGSSFKDASILYEVFNGIDLISREIVQVNNHNRTLRIPFRKEWKDGIFISFTLVKEGKLYTDTKVVYRQYPDRTLTFKPQIFRDRLQPGQKEQWSFRITDSSSQSIHAEVLAFMYDKSLDQIYPYDFRLPFSNRSYISTYQFTEGIGLQSTNESAYGVYKPVDVPVYNVDKLDWQGITFFSNIYVTRGGRLMKSTAFSRTGGEGILMADAVTTEAGILSENTVKSVDTGMETTADSVIIQGDVRQNFNETAFFYPVLVSDAEGNVHISFTIPESNTTWQLNLLAHTQDLKYGLYNDLVITQKPVMVIPNLPRFVRKGDKVSLTAQLVNKTENQLTGVAVLEFFDPVTEEIVDWLKTNSTKEITLETGEMKPVSWQCDIPYTEEMIGVRIIFTTPEGSDGEQHLLPVVSDEILITESTPFYLNDEKQKLININSELYRKGNRPFSLSFEATANPVWYAVQALPVLSEPKDENIVDWFNVYYSNVIAQALIHTTPRLQLIINAWNQQGGDAGTLLSQLEKNEELKQVLLSETPWVMEAQNEREQKQRLALLFDINRAAQQKENALQKIVELQQENGSWGWFKGFYPSRQMTLYVLKGMKQLVELDAIEYNQQEREVQIRALNWLDKMIKEEYDALQKNNKELKNYVPSPLQIEYLWVRSAYRDIPEAGESREAIRYFTAQAEKQWEKLALKEKAEVAILMHRNGKSKIADKIVDSFRKTATLSTELGMYWANNRLGVGYFTSPIEVHGVIMEMFRIISPLETESNRMKQWLLTQKRTQYWNTTPGTVSAIYSILKTGSDWLENTNRIDISWNGLNITTGQGETATGYIKEVIHLLKEKSITDSIIEIKKEGVAPAWGAVYSQYFTKIENVLRSDGVLNIEKKLFIETNNGEQRQISPVTAERPLQIGDKIIVRLTIRTDREMNYVYLHDLRPGYMEPAQQLSGLQFRDGLIYYSSPRDLSENFFIERLPAGTFVMEYSGYVSRSGNYSGGVATIQCLYAPEYISHTGGERLEVE